MFSQAPCTRPDVCSASVYHGHGAYSTVYGSCLSLTIRGACIFLVPVLVHMRLCSSCRCLCDSPLRIIFLHVQHSLSFTRPDAFVAYPVVYQTRCIFVSQIVLYQTRCICCSSCNVPGFVASLSCTRSGAFVTHPLLYQPGAFVTYPVLHQPDVFVTYPVLHQTRSICDSSFLVPAKFICDLSCLASARCICDLSYLAPDQVHL
jgi:hypothetical protein